MEDWTQTFDERLKSAQMLDYEPESADLLEEALKLADRNNDESRALLARYLFVFAVAPLDPRRALVEFAWCAGHRDGDTRFLPAHAIPQLYGIAVGILRSYPDYSLEQIERTLEEMELAFDEAGLDRRDVYHHRIYAALGTGRRDEARTWYRKWMQTPPRHAVCDACERGTQVLFHMHGEDYERGLEIARPLLDGRLSCKDGQPLSTYSASLIPLYRLERHDEADRYYRSARQLLEGMGYAALWAAGRQLCYASLTGRRDHAFELFERWAPRAFRHGTDTDRFGFMLASHIFCRLLEDDGESHELAIPPVESAPPTPGGRVVVSQLRTWVDAQIDDLCRRFDERNRNGEYTRIASLYRELWDEPS